MDVPFLDLQAAYLELRSDIDQACRRVLGSGWYRIRNHVIAVSCVKLLSAHNSTQHTSRKHKV